MELSSTRGIRGPGAYNAINYMMQHFLSNRILPNPGVHLAQYSDSFFLVGKRF